MRSELLAALVFALPLTAVAAAPAPTPLEAVTRTLGEDFGARLAVMLCAAPDRMTRDGGRQLRASRPDLPAAELDAFDARLAETAPRMHAACEERVAKLLAGEDGPRAQYVARLREALPAALAPREIEQLRTFLASPAGRHTEAVRRDVEGAAYEQVVPWAQQVAPGLYGELGMMLRADVGMPSPKAAAPPTPAIQAKLRNAAALGERCGPFYPDAARRAGEQGSVVLLVHLSDAGRVIGLLLEASSGYPSLDVAAAACVGANGEFEPLRINGAAVPSWQRMKWTWRLTE
ncbi:MAG: energy transducer TonB [Proteobacteria bacterium]|nr:energy transducer TonB [Pseudomonadota bacterium]